MVKPASILARRSSASVTANDSPDTGCTSDTDHPCWEPVPRVSSAIVTCRNSGSSCGDRSRLSVVFRHIRDLVVRFVPRLMRAPLGARNPGGGFIGRDIIDGLSRACSTISTPSSGKPTRRRCSFRTSVRRPSACLAIPSGRWLDGAGLLGQPRFIPKIASGWSTTCAAAVQDVRDLMLDYRVRAADGRTVLGARRHARHRRRARPRDAADRSDARYHRLKARRSRGREPRPALRGDSSKTAIDLITFVDANGAHPVRQSLRASVCWACCRPSVRAAACSS